MLTLRRTYAVFRKEFIQIIRDPRALSIAFILPVIMLILNGYAITTDVKHIKTAVLDRDLSYESRQLVERISNSGYFDIKLSLDREGDIKKVLDGGRVKAVVSIPYDFAKRLTGNQTARIQVVIDGTDSNTAMVVTGYLERIIQGYSLELLSNKVQAMGISTKPAAPIELIPRIYYNPTLRSTNFLVPGLICSIMMILAVVLTSLSFVSEKERGTMEQVVASPVKSYELVIGKLLPYSLISMSALISIILFSVFLFHVPVKGNLFVLFIMSTVFIIGALGQGLLISTVARSGQEAFLMSFLSSLLPSFLLSGFIFPISNMPRIIQAITYVIPARYYITIARGIFIKGVGWEAFWRESLYLLAFSVVIILLSFTRFKKKL